MSDATFTAWPYFGVSGPKVDVFHCIREFDSGKCAIYINKDLRGGVHRRSLIKRIFL